MSDPVGIVSGVYIVTFDTPTAENIEAYFVEHGHFHPVDRAGTIAAAAVLDPLECGAVVAGVEHRYTLVANRHLIRWAARDDDAVSELLARLVANGVLLTVLDAET